MKKFLLATVASTALLSGARAADMPTKAPVYKAPAAAYDWSGFYGGVFAGVGIQRSRGDDPTGDLAGRVEYTGTGFTGGMTAGYNWQFNQNWLVGIEGDIGYLGLSHNVRDYNDDLLYNSKTSWIATLRGRVGYIIGPTVNYITGGAAFVGFKDSVSDIGLAGTSASSSKTKGGYTFGSGIETMLGGNWTAKAEYSVVDVGRGTTLTTVEAFPFTLQTKHRFDTMKFGLNYLFGGKTQPPLMAHNWTGLYAGGLAGVGTTKTRAVGAVGFVAELGNNANGFTAGGLAGFNWQFAPQLVAGVEGDFSYLGIKHSAVNYNESGVVYGLKTSWLGTLRGRIGYSTGPAFLYITGGGAWVRLEDQWVFTAPQVNSSKTLSGGTVGGGIEAVLGGNWTTRAEYLYVDVGKGNQLASSETLQADHIFHIFRSGLIYKFGSP